MNIEFNSLICIHVLDADLQKLASNFSCGNAHIDQFLRSPLALDIGFGTTYVWLDEKETEIIGYYNITTGAIEETSEYGVYKLGGAAHINEFAMSVTYQKTPVSENIYASDLLLTDCIERIKAIRNNGLGFAFITLQSTNEGHYLYYRNDFCDVEEDMNIVQIKESEIGCIPMYLALDIE